MAPIPVGARKPEVERRPKGAGRAADLGEPEAPEHELTHDAVPADERPLPSVDKYDSLLGRETS